MDGLTPEQWRIINYLNFKMQCAADQEDIGIRLDYEKAVGHRDEITALIEPKIKELSEVMPKVPKITKKTKPKITHKKDGTLSANGEKWFSLLKKHKLPMDFNGELSVITGYDIANPGSSQQVKDWLFSLGWKPTTYKYVKDKSTGAERKIEQVRKDGELCPSVVKLAEKNPEVSILEGLTILQHRLGVFQGFIDSAVQQEDGTWRVYAGVAGLTNTLRFKHRKPIANLPKVGVPWGEEIRGCLIATEGQVLCGSDMVSLESTTKRHYMQPLDPDYVDKMSQEGFDEHINLASFAGAMTKDEEEFYKWYQQKS